MKKILSFILCVSVLFFFGCKAEKIENSSVNVAMVSGEYSQLLYEEIFSNDENISYFTYNSITDAVMAIESGKADYTILNDFQLNAFTVAERDISIKEKSGYSIDYCAYFEISNTQLQSLFNEAISNLQKSGELEKIKESYIKNGYCETKENNSNGELVMLCYPYFENRIFLDENDNLCGVDFEIAKAICSYMGYELCVKTADFDDLFVMLENGEGDFIISSTEYNSERAEKYLYSLPYYTESFYIVERGNN